MTTADDTARELRTLRYDLEDARRNETRANGRMVTMRSALTEATGEIGRLRAALQEIAEYGGGDGGDWVECCNIASAALAAGDEATNAS